MHFLPFLKLVEGNEYRPYVPPVGNSGVTIGIGVDIGNLNPDSLDIPEELKERLRPYFRFKRDNARYALLANPLVLTKEEVDLISMAAIQLHLNELIRWFNRASEIPFDRLTDNQQTVLISVKYQYGDLPRRTPKFWGFATRGEWRNVYYELRNFGDRHPTRRNREADLLAADFRMEVTPPPEDPLPSTVTEPAPLPETNNRTERRTWRFWRRLIASINQ